MDGKRLGSPGPTPNNQSPQFLFQFVSPGLHSVEIQYRATEGTSEIETQKRLEQFAKKAREYDAKAKKAHNLQRKKVYEGFARSYRKLAVVQAKKGKSA